MAPPATWPLSSLGGLPHTCLVRSALCSSPLLQGAPRPSATCSGEDHHRGALPAPQIEVSRGARAQILPCPADRASADNPDTTGCATPMRRDTTCAVRLRTPQIPVP